jgi:hypothetical protein
MHPWLCHVTKSGLKVRGLYAQYLHKSFEMPQVGDKFGDLHDFIPQTQNESLIRLTVFNPLV